MNLNDFKTENMGVLVGKLILLTQTDVLVWESEYPIDLSDPNNQSYYFNLVTPTEVSYKIYFEKNYDPVCMGLVTMLYWYDSLQNKERIILDYTDPTITTLFNEIGSQMYRKKINHQGSNIDELNLLVNEGSYGTENPFVTNPQFNLVGKSLDALSIYQVLCVVPNNDSQYIYAKFNSEDNTRNNFAGIVSEIFDNQPRVLSRGFITWGTDLVSGSKYYADGNGGITNIVPTTKTKYEIGIAFTNRILLVDLNVTTENHWEDILSKPTTILGFGISDAYNKNEIDNRLNDIETDYKSVDENLQQQITEIASGNLVTSEDVDRWNTSVSGNVDFERIIDKPNTLSGYGIGDSYTKIQVDSSIGSVNSDLVTHKALSNPHNTTKGDIGLSNVDNTSDANKPVSTATQTAINAKVTANSAITGATKTKVTYDSKGLITGGSDITKTDVGLGNVDNTSDTNKPISTATQTALNTKVTANVAIVGATKTKVTYDANGLVTGGSDITKTDVGLGNVDNTSDTNKPISTATQTALNAKVTANGAITGATKTKVTYDSKGLVTGGSDITKTDVGLDNVDNTSDANKPISTATQTALNAKVTANGAIAGATKTKITYDSKGLVTGGSDITKTDVGLGNVDNTSDANKPVSSATQTALNAKVNANVAITGATKTKVTYDVNGLVTGGSDATQDDIGNGATYGRLTNTLITDLTDSGDTSLHYHSTDRDRANHTGTQTASTISDLTTTVEDMIDAKSNVTPYNFSGNYVSQLTDRTVRFIGNVKSVYTLPSAVGSGRKITIYNSSTNDSVLNILCVGTDKIYDMISFDLYRYESITLVDNGLNDWEAE